MTLETARRLPSDAAAGVPPRPPGPEARLAGHAEVTQEQKEKLLRRSFVFRDLSPELLRRLAGVTQVVRVPKGATLFRQEDEGDSLYAVISGLVRIAVSGRGGRELIIGLFEPGDVFGEIALLDGLPRTASAQAEQDTTVLVIHRAPFTALIAEEPALARHLIELLCERLRDSTEHLGEYAFLSVRCRLAKKLRALAIAHGRYEADGVRIALRLSQTDIGQMLGVTREAVNKQLKGWCRQGVLSLERGTILVRDMAALAAAASPDDD
ncbi:MAG: Crp/Fnr family transcriptional regulator [Rhodospirillaceae bacterium]|nr:Crp/Fnr family transcriptional regulator [Rhodospirillaceae bacterium]